ncbi:MAG: RAD55 family ATPase, partial [Actinomycetota bacterium]
VGERARVTMATGIRRLDEALDGGVPDHSAVLVYGPPFTGKTVLSNQFAAAGLAQGVPAIFVLTDQPASEARQELAAIDPDYEKHEEAGLVQFVDAYSRSVGAEDPHKRTEYLDGPIDLSSLALAVNNAQRKVIPLSSAHRLVFRSVSTLMAYTNAQTTFRFLQIFVGKTKRAGATSMMHLEQGMHTEPEVQMIKHLVDGVLSLKVDAGKHTLHLEGLGVTSDRGWVEYRYSPVVFEITGSFGAGRIR